MSDANQNLSKRTPLDGLFEESQGKEEFVRGYTEHLSKILLSLNAGEVARFIDVLLDTRDQGGRIFFLGNGGSAATASHFANDLLAGMRLRDDQKPFKAIALTDNVALMTAIANDEGYVEVFKKQLEVLMEKKDVVVAISASGNSPNLIRAIEYANSRGNRTVGLVGFDGGKIKQICSHTVLVPTEKGEYGPVEDVHMILDHMVTSYLYRAVRARQ